MYKFFMSLKQKDGSFLVAHHSEVDVRYVTLLSLISHSIHFCKTVESIVF